MSNKLTPLAFLIEQSQAAVDDAAKQLAQQVNQFNQQQQKLHTLTQYVADYDRRLIQQAQAGIHADELDNFNAFLAKLNQAVSQQTFEVSKQSERLANAKRIWQMAQAKLKSFEVLSQRATMRAQAIENKRLQKQNDEFAMLSLLRAQKEN